VLQTCVKQPKNTSLNTNTLFDITFSVLYFKNQKLLQYIENCSFKGTGKVKMTIITSGQSNLTLGCIAAARGKFNHIRYAHITHGSASDCYF